MKKVLVFLLAAMMLASVGCAWAEGTTEEVGEITFQDITWGSSKEEVKSWAKKNGFETFVDFGSYTEAFLDATGKYCTGFTKVGAISEDDKILQARDNISFQIAGYTIYGLDFQFDVQDKKTELCTVVVYIQRDVTDEQAQAILDDLEQKLITVYGENTVTSTDNSSSSSVYGYDFSSLLTSGYTYSGSTSMIVGDRYRKVGAEDTAVCLTKMMNRVMLVYGKIHAPEAEEKNETSFTIDSYNIGGL